MSERDDRQAAPRFPLPRREQLVIALRLLVALLNYAADHLPERYARWRPLARALAGVAAALVLLLSGANVAVQYTDEPAYLATAVLAAEAGRERDVNLVAWRAGDGVRIVRQAPATDAGGHARLARWRASLPGIPGVALPAAPELGWNPTYMRAIAAGERGLRYCDDELMATPDVREAMVRALTDTFAVPGVLPPERVSCAFADVVLALTPERDCGTPLALGCAAFDGRATRVTVRADLPAAVAYWVTRHEAKHAGNLDHTLASSPSSSGDGSSYGGGGFGGGFSGGGFGGGGTSAG